MTSQRGLSPTRRMGAQLITDSHRAKRDIILAWTRSLKIELAYYSGGYDKARVTDDEIVFTGRGWRVILRQRLGEDQRGALALLRKTGTWRRYSNNGWCWGSPGQTARLLDSLVDHWLVEKGPHATYKPISYDASGRRLKRR